MINFERQKEHVFNKNLEEAIQKRENKDNLGTKN